MLKTSMPDNSHCQLKIFFTTAVEASSTQISAGQQLNFSWTTATSDLVFLSFLVLGQLLHQSKRHPEGSLRAPTSIQVRVESYHHADAVNQ